MLDGGEPTPTPGEPPIATPPAPLRDGGTDGDTGSDAQRPAQDAGRPADGGRETDATLDAAGDASRDRDGGNDAASDAAQKPDSAPSDGGLPPVDPNPEGPPDVAGCTSGTPAYALSYSGELFGFDPSSPFFITSIGVPKCPITLDVKPLAIAVTRGRVAYVMYSDRKLYRIDTTTLDCEPTGYASQAGGNDGDFAVVRVDGAERLFELDFPPGPTAQATLVRADLSTFATTRVGPITPLSDKYFYGLMQSDAYNRLFAVSNAGLMLQIDPRTGAVVAADQVRGFSAPGGVAPLVLGRTLYLFEGDTAITRVWRWDLATQVATKLVTLGSVGIACAAAPPCTP